MIAFNFKLFTDQEYDQLAAVVSHQRLALEALRKQQSPTDTRESNFRFHTTREASAFCQSIQEQCRKAKYLRLSETERRRQDGRLEGIEALTPNTDNEDFELLAKEVKAAIENGTPELGLDRLHTFSVKYIRAVYKRHFAREPNQDMTANKLLGEYANDLRSNGTLESKMASEILKSSTRALSEFNYLRNNLTLAHDNPLLSRNEAYFIYSTVAASIRFIRELEEKVAGERQ